MSELILNAYRPNMSDPRVRQRIHAVLEWCDLLVAVKQPRRINSATLRKVFGNTSQPLGQWLRANLLIQTGGYEVGKSSYGYLLNQRGYEKLCDSVGFGTRSAAQVARKLCEPILQGDVALDYNDSGTRRYHPIQNLPREVRKQIFVGWYDYDIESSAATLIHQYASKHYNYVHSTLEEPFPAVARLISEKATIRQHIVDLLGLSLDAAKELLQSLLFRAPLAPHSTCSVYRLLGENRLILEKLKQDSFVSALMADLKRMWRYAMLADKYEKASLLFRQGNVAAHKAKASLHRHAIYLGLERKVIDAIQIMLGSQQFPGILMHDGFLTQLDLETAVVESHVEQVTGFKIKLKKERLGWIM